MNIGRYCGLLGAVASLISYLIFGMLPDIFGVDYHVRFDMLRKILQHFLSLLSGIGYLMFFILCSKHEVMHHGNEEPCDMATSGIQNGLCFSRRDFWSRAKWLVAAELFIGYPLICVPFFGHKSPLVFSFWETTPYWCIVAMFLGVLIVIVARFLLLPLVIRRFRDCNFPCWFAVFVFIMSFMPNVWWAFALLMIMIAGFVGGSCGEIDSNKDEPNEPSEEVVKQ